MRRFRQFQILMVVLLLAGCASMGATNTTSTNVGVTAYETAGATLTTAYNTEKALLKSGKITAEQDASFQMGPYKAAVDCYKAIGSAAVMVLVATDTSAKATAQAKLDALNKQLPGLLLQVTSFIEGR
jgi:hypothetical protein